ncbi:MAG: iron-sulfur cluster assembly accessory protein [Myxococcales bacterium]|nr:iron-sulfur cluster assembly accessory protein [Myxococcales bacterium]
MTVSQVAQTPSDVPLSVRGGADVVVPASTSTPTSTAAPPSRGSITVTPGAVSAIRKQIQKRGRAETALRVGIRGGGCSGFSYVIEFHDGAPRPKDVIFDYDDVRVLVDPKSLLYLNGSTLDWEQTLMRQGFKFVNPNEKSSCGCGHSFTV